MTINVGPDSSYACTFICSIKNLWKITGVYKVPHSPSWGGGYQILWGRILSCEEGKVIIGLLKENHVEKRVRGSNIICSI